VSGIFLGISIRSLSLQSTTPLKHEHGYGHTNTLHVSSIPSISINTKCMIHLLINCKNLPMLLHRFSPLINSVISLK
jgi:hypothetical protein